MITLSIQEVCNLADNYDNLLAKELHRFIYLAGSTGDILNMGISRINPTTGKWAVDGDLWYGTITHLRDGEDETKIFSFRTSTKYVQELVGADTVAFAERIQHPIWIDVNLNIGKILNRGADLQFLANVIDTRDATFIRHTEDPLPPKPVEQPCKSVELTESEILDNISNPIAYAFAKLKARLKPGKWRIVLRLKHTHNREYPWIALTELYNNDAPNRLYEDAYYVSDCFDPTRLTYEDITNLIGIPYVGEEIAIYHICEIPNR